jgi:hypothetical protein
MTSFINFCTCFKFVRQVLYRIITGSDRISSPFLPWQSLVQEILSDPVLILYQALSRQKQLGNPVRSCSNPVVGSVKAETIRKSCQILFWSCTRSDKAEQDRTGNPIRSLYPALTRQNRIVQEILSDPVLILYPALTGRTGPYRKSCQILFWSCTRLWQGRTGSYRKSCQILFWSCTRSDKAEQDRTGNPIRSLYPKAEQS